MTMDTGRSPSGRATHERSHSPVSPPPVGVPNADDLLESWLYLHKWVERGLFCSHTDAKTALECIAYHPSAPWNNGRWDVDHKPYAGKFYKTFPKAIATEAHRAETVQHGSVHEGVGPKDIAQGPSQ